MYPVTTILLAAGILRERLTRVQLGGVVLALVAVGLVSTG
jgi:drug/metabolite transporter (DMT)-like permease